MSNDVVIIEIDRPRRLRFNYDALKTLCARTGKKIEDMDDELSSPSSFEWIEVAFHAALQEDATAHGETLTPEKAVELMNQVPYGLIYQKIAAAWVAAFPVPEGN